MPRSTLLLSALLLLASPLFIACGSTIQGGGAGAGAGNGGGGGGGGGGGEGGEGGEGGSDTGEGGGGAAPVCEGPKPQGCAYNIVVCRADGWQCGETPLVLSFSGEEVAFRAGATAAFDLTGEGQSVSSDWPTASTPWLALDRNGDGTIGDGTELFGSAVLLSSGLRARNGFEALAELDEDGNGRIDALDRRFGELSVWADANADRRTDPSELQSAAAGSRRIVSIELGYHVAPACDARGNCGVERAAFTWTDAAGALHRGMVIDVHLPLRDF